MNYDAIDAGAKQVVEVEVPESWKDAADEGLATPHIADGGRADAIAFAKNIQAKVNAQEGNTLPVSAFNDYIDGSTPSGTSAYEKRGIAVDIPVWNPDQCIQCNRCAYVCPHAVIRPVALTEEEVAQAPEGLKTLDMIGMPGMKFTMTVSAYDCTGCGSCVNVCPGKKNKETGEVEKALTMANMELMQESRHSSTLVERFRLNQKLLLNSKRQQLREASSNSHSLSSQELVQDVVRHHTLS